MRLRRWCCRTLPQRFVTILIDAPGRIQLGAFEGSSGPIDAMRERLRGAAAVGDPHSITFGAKTFVFARETSVERPISVEKLTLGDVHRVRGALCHACVIPIDAPSGLQLVAFEGPFG